LWAKANLQASSLRQHFTHSIVRKCFAVLESITEQLSPQSKIGTLVRGSGGTQGGMQMFVIGMLMAIAGVYLFFDSVRVSSGHHGALSGMLGGGGNRGRLMETTSMGILFVPFFLGVFSLFVDARRKWAWMLTYVGIAILAVEVVSRVRFIIDTKLTHLLMMLVLFAAGCALMFRSYRANPPESLASLTGDKQRDEDEQPDREKQKDEAS